MKKTKGKSRKRWYDTVDISKKKSMNCCLTGGGGLREVQEQNNSGGGTKRTVFKHWNSKYI